MPACCESAGFFVSTGVSTGFGEQAAIKASRTIATAQPSPVAPLHYCTLKIDFGILTWTPIVPSTSCVIATSPARLVS